MTEKKKYENLTSPIGTAKYPHLAEPDTKGDYATGKYKVELVLSPADASTFLAQVEDAGKRLSPETVNPHLPFRTKDGVTSVVFKSQHKPAVVDSLNQPLPAGFMLRSGSKIRVKTTVAHYKTGINEGFTLYLNAVQIIEAAPNTGGFNEGFTQVDNGYVFNQAADHEPF